MPPIRLKRLYRNQAGQTSHDFCQVLPHKLTINPSYVARKNPGPYKETLFREVEVVPSREAVGNPPIFRRKPGTWQTTTEALVEETARRLLQVIEEQWKPGRFHVVYCSSGMDSRNISGAIRRLYQRNGDDWLGRVLFVCTKWETESFRAIMRWQGWDESQYTVVNEHVPDGEYYASSLRFKDAWRWAGGVAGIPVNIFWYPVADLQAQGVLPTDDQLQVFAGYWGNEMVGQGAQKRRLARMIWDTYYYLAMAARPIKGNEVVLPFTYSEVLEPALDASCAPRFRLRKTLPRYLNEGMPRIRHIKGNGDLGHTISPRLFKKAKEDYARSWYGRKVRPDVKPIDFIEYCRWWSDWTAASLVEHLRRQGYSIQVEG